MNIEKYITENLYLDSGYLNMELILSTPYPFIFLPAARGTGKTYGALSYYLKNDKKMMLLRRRQNEADLQLSHDSSSFLEPAEDAGIDYWIQKQKRTGLLYKEGREDWSAFIAALATFATVRGAFNFAQVTDIFFDEFIAETHVQKIKNEGMALANLYESVNRNRELKGQKPVKLCCAANSVNMANDTFMYFGIVTNAEEMMQTGQEVRVIGNKLLILPQRSPISARKAKTALYEAVNQEFSDMAINNKFILNDFSYVGRRNLKDYQLLFKAGDLYFYQHKSDKSYYVCQTAGTTKNSYASGYAGLEKLRRDKHRWPAYYLDGKISFDNYLSIALFEKYFDLS